MGETTRQKINKEIKDLNTTINQLDLSDIYRTPLPTTGECTSFVHRTFSRIEYMLYNKTSLKFKRIEIIQSILE